MKPRASKRDLTPSACRAQNVVEKPCQPCLQTSRQQTSRQQSMSDVLHAVESSVKRLGAAAGAEGRPVYSGQ
jgi:hypothetical protein